MANPKRGGRPPTVRVSRTSLARWMSVRDLRTADLHAKCVEVAPKIGVPPEMVPPVKSLADVVLGRYAPNVVVLLLIRHVTGGDVDLEHWARDLYLAPAVADSHNGVLDA